MKITKSQLKRIIKEEFEVIKEGGTGERIENLMDELQSLMSKYPGTTINDLRAVLDDLEWQLSEDKKKDDDFLGDVKSTGEWTDYTIGELEKKKAALMKKKKRTADEVKTVRQLNFAINAKQGDYEKK